MPSVFSRLDGQCFRFPPGSHSGKPRSPTTVARATRQEASPTTECCAKAVLGRVAKPLVRVEEASHLSYTRNCCRLASRRLSAVLEMALQNQTRGSLVATPDPALSNPVLPRTAKGSAYRLASQVFRTGDHVVAKLGVTVEQEESVRWHVRPCLSHLLRDPKSVGSARYVKT